MIEIVPSILSADFARLADEIARVERGGARMLHLDVMDGHFVPNLTIGPPVVESIRKATRLHLDVHLMIENPERYVAAFVAGRRQFGLRALRGGAPSGWRARHDPQGRRDGRRGAQSGDPGRAFWKTLWKWRTTCFS